MNDMRVLSYELPEDIMKAKWAGDFDFARRLIDARLAGEGCSEPLRARLELERERLATLPAQYPYSRAQALEEMRRLIPGFSGDELDALDLEGATDWIYIGGERRYFGDFQWTLLKMKPDLGARAGRPQRNVGIIPDWIAELRAKGEAARRLRMRAELRVTDEAFVPGETYTVHLPIPAEAAQVEDIRLERFSHEPARVAPLDAAQRTVCFRETLAENQTFFAEYSWVCRLRWFDAENPPAPGVLYPNAAPPCEDDLAELPPHVSFSPYLRALAREIGRGAAGPLDLAKRYYDYITNTVRYSYLRAYLHLDHLADYTALDRKGDCGAQALLFISLCRLSGIPARWQSGLYAEPGDPGSHDWAQFYTQEYGWLFADCSFGGAGKRRGAESRRAFYFGNLDPYRMVANRAYQEPFDPPKRFLRKDPFDNQRGECESSSRGLVAADMRTALTVLSCEEV